jgi:CheY-like chemotaxis protein
VRCRRFVVENGTRPAARATRKATSVSQTVFGRAHMNSHAKTSSGANSLWRATSDLNNALQLVSATAALVDNAWKGSDRSEKYLAMLRASIDRAEVAAAELVKQTGGAGAKTLMHPQLAAFAGRGSVPSGGGARQTILLVDDEAMALALVKRILVEAGYNVICAQSGFECLELFRNAPDKFDLVLLDLTMPMMNGEETFHRLRHIRPDAPIVLCAGFIQQDQLDRLLEEGLAGLLRKPLAPDEIVGHVRSTLESVKYSRGAEPSPSVARV